MAIKPVANNKKVKIKPRLTRKFKEPMSNTNTNVPNIHPALVGKMYNNRCLKICSLAGLRCFRSERRSVVNNFCFKKWSMIQHELIFKFGKMCKKYS
jgi:hypothetical protein